jgi:hypothetical protein
MLTVPSRLSSILCNLNFGGAVRKTTAEFSSLVHSFKSDLFTYIEESFCLQLYVDAKIGNIFFPEPLTFLYLGSHTSENKSAHFTDWNFCFRPLTLSRSVSSSWRLPGACTTSKDKGEVYSWISFSTFLRSKVVYRILYVIFQECFSTYRLR